MTRGTEGCRFDFFVISAAPREIVVSALDGVVPAEHIYGTELEFDVHSGEVRAIKRVPAGYGKVAVIDELEHRLGVTPDRVIYVGDGSSDVHVMLHVNNHGGFTIAVSENRTARADRPEHRSQRQRIQHPAADSRPGVGLGDAPDSRPARIVRPDLEWLGTGAHRSGRYQRVLGIPGVFTGARRMNHPWTDALGWVATAIFVASYFFSRASLLRAVQMVGALLWITYGLLIDASRSSQRTRWFFPPRPGRQCEQRLAMAGRHGVRAPPSGHFGEPPVMPSTLIACAGRR